MSVRGHLRLRAALDETGRTCLREQSFSAPAHLGKTYLEAGVLHAQIVCPTAGLLDGDTLDLDVTVDAGARFRLTTPAATRVHTMKDGEAVVRQKFNVSAGGWLEVRPEIFIPQAGARYRQHTEIAVERGGGLLFWEIVTPGRTASGENFLYDRLSWNTSLWWDGSLIARERYTLSPTTSSLSPLRGIFPQGCYASIFFISESPETESSFPAELLALQSERIWIGCTRLVQKGWVIKLITADSVTLRATLQKIQTLLPCNGGL